MKIYNILANQDFVLAPQVAKVAEISSDYGAYTEDPHQSVRVVISDNWAGVLERSLNADDNVIEYAEDSDPRDGIF